MAEVYKATDLRADHAEVAVKMIGGPDHRLSSKVFDSEYRSLVRLEHPNIVRLLDGGRDEETNQRFLVFEWMEEDLAGRLREGSTPEGWDDFARDLGHPLFSALAAAHDASVAHRDIKPANILIDTEGVPRLADFGIAKITTDIAPGYTVADFRTPPFAAPPAEGIDRHTSGDVYSLGVTALAVLSRINPFEPRFREQPRLFVEEAIAAIDAPAEATRFLARCTAVDSRERPRSGAVALAELEALILCRDAEAKKLGFATTPTCHLSLAAKAREALMVDFDLESEREAEETLLADLEEMAFLLPVSGRGGEDGREGHFFLLGGELRCHVALMSSAPVLRVQSVRRESGFYLDRDRERSWSGILRFSLDPPREPAFAERELAELIDGVLEVAVGRSRERRRSEDDQTISIWRRSLQALNEIERSREQPIAYSNFRVVGGGVAFSVSGSLVGGDLVGQTRIAELTDGALLVGQVTQVSGGEMTLRVEQGDPRQLPRAGKLKVDLRLSQAALRRQESTLDAVQRGAVVRPALRHILADPSGAAPPEQVGEPSWIQDDLDLPKREAVEAAMGSPDVLLVEGPPGTGKTTLIAELVAQELARDREMRILISSQTHSALDNVLERLDDLDLDCSPRMLRIGRVGHERIAAGVSSLLVDPQLEEWREEVISGGRDYLRKWSSEREISVRGVEIAMRLDELAAVLEGVASTRGSLVDAERQLQILRDTRRSGGETSNETISGVQDRIVELRDEVRRAERLRDDLLERLGQLDKGLAGTLSSLSPEEARARAAEAVDRSHSDYEQCSKFLRLLGDWHARFGRGPEFQAAALVRAQIVAGTCVGLASTPGWEEIEFDLCIVDEASKANATEILIPMSRADRWVLVGDHRQLPPHIDEALLDSQLLARLELSEDQLRETLFERLRRHLPEQSRVILSEQHRMTPAVGSLISSCFYDNEFHSAPKERPGWLGMALKTPVLWLSTSDAPKRAEERAGSGRTNPLEARCIRNLLGSLNLVAAAAKEVTSVAILAGYREQCEEINRQIAKELTSWPALEIECNTVDAFQGREADVAIYSVTRSNEDGRLGFLAESRRLNVALSRGRLGLVIVGDDQFAYSARGDNPFRKVLDYMESSEGCSFEEART
jgi:hypothetical protein